MEWRDLMVDSYGRVLEMLEEALKGVSPEDLGKQPKADCNSMGWIVWHLTRGQDAQISHLCKGEQVWIQGKWYIKFHRAPNASDTGFGDTSEQVSAFKSPSADVLLEYHRAVLEHTRNYLITLTPEELGRKLDEPRFDPPPTVGVRIVSILADCLGHAGEIDYLRGLLAGKAWLGY